MVNQYWIKQAETGSCLPPWACGNLPVFQAKRYYFDTFSLQTLYTMTFGKFLYNFFKTNKGRIK